jgi:hypothetical protein
LRATFTGAIGLPDAMGFVAAEIAGRLTGDNRNSRLATFRIPDPTTK